MHAMPTKTFRTLKEAAVQFLRDVEQADTITIFRHVFPDADAYGSQLGLKAWLQDAYPEKRVLALGSEGQEGVDEADDEIIQNSLAIVCDTSNGARVDDDRWKKAKRIVRFDHHVLCEEFPGLDLVDSKATATCELLALILKAGNVELDQEAAQHFYEGLISDNINFSITTVRPETFEAAAWLLEQGADVVKAKSDLFDKDLETYRFENVIRSKAVQKEKFLFSVISAADYLGAGQSFAFAKEKVYCLSGISSIEVWVLFTQMEDGLHYSASLRSRTIPVRDLAARYGGGGHECASGIKNLTISEVEELIELLTARSMQNR